MSTLIILAGMILAGWTALLVWAWITADDTDPWLPADDDRRRWRDDIRRPE